MIDVGNFSRFASRLSLPWEYRVFIYRGHHLRPNIVRNQAENNASDGIDSALPCTLQLSIRKMTLRPGFFPMYESSLCSHGKNKSLVIHDFFYDYCQSQVLVHFFLWNGRVLQHYRSSSVLFFRTTGIAADRRVNLYLAFSRPGSISWTAVLSGPIR